MMRTPVSAWSFDLHDEAFLVLIAKIKALVGQNDLQAPRRYTA